MLVFVAQRIVFLLCFLFNISFLPGSMHFIQSVLIQTMYVFCEFEVSLKSLPNAFFQSLF